MHPLITVLTGLLMGTPSTPKDQADSFECTARQSLYSAVGQASEHPSDSLNSTPHKNTELPYIIVSPSLAPAVGLNDAEMTFTARIRITGSIQAALAKADEAARWGAVDAGYWGEVVMRTKAGDYVYSTFWVLPIRER